MQVVDQPFLLGQIVRRLFDETAFPEPVRGHRGEQKQLLDAGGAGTRLDTLHQSFAVAPASVLRMNRDTRQFRLIVAVGIQGGTADDHPVVLDHGKTRDLAFEQFTRAPHQRPAFLHRLDQRHQAADVVGTRIAQNLQRFARDDRAHAITREEFEQQGSVLVVADEMHPPDTRTAGAHGR